MARVEPIVVHEQDCPVEQWEESQLGGVSWRTLLSSDRTPSQAMTMGVAEVPPGPRALRLHRHAHPEIYYILAGEGRILIDGAEHVLRPGAAVFIPGDAEHGSRNTGVDVLRILYVFPSDSFADIEYRFSDP